MPNQEKTPWYALTTVQRVKDILQIDDDGFDTLLTRYVVGATDFVERQCGKNGPEKYPNDGHFVLKKYVQEVYSVRGKHQQKLLLRNAPVFYAILQGTTTAGNPTITGLADTTGVQPGMPIISEQFPIGTKVLSVAATSVTMTLNAGTSSTEAIAEVSGLLKFQWRAGTPSNPSWTDFIADQFELEEQGTSGILRVYGTMPQLYSNMLRATYWAGFPVDWDNAGNAVTHRLPGDLTRLTENLIVRMFKRRKDPGKNGETLNGATINWKDALDAMDTHTIQTYTRVGSIF